VAQDDCKQVPSEMLSLDRILAGISEVLQKRVVGAVPGAFERGQVWAIIDLLDNLRGRVAWGGEQLVFENDGLTRLAAAVLEHLPEGDLRERFRAFAVGAEPSSARSLAGRALVCELLETGLADRPPVAALVDEFLASDAFLRALALKQSRLSEISQG
jgi:hypothetical protein